MTANEIAPLMKKQLIKPEDGNSLQDQVEKALKNGFQRIILEGAFKGENQFSLLTLSSNIEIVGRAGTTLDGQNLLGHLVFIKDGIKVKIKGITFKNGNTSNIASQLSLENHPKDKLNIFRYLDGGAISIGEESELILENCSFDSNYSTICAGAISNLGGYVHVKDSVFRNNHCGDTGAAIDNLAAGSLTVIEYCQFENNQANHLGSGTFGAVTAFPNTYLVVKGSDFSEETKTAIDYRPNKQGQSFVFIDQATKFNPQVLEPVVKNPSLNKGIRTEIPLLYVKILATRPSLVKLEGIPRANKETTDKHKKIFESLIQA